MEKEFDYYLIKNTGAANVPLLKNNDAIDPRGIGVVYVDEFCVSDKPVYLALNRPIPAKPNFNADYYQLPSAVYSQKIYDALSPLNIKGYQLIPGIIVDKKGVEHKNFWLENAYTRLLSLDKDKSVYTYSSFCDTWTWVEKIVLDREALSRIPLDERIIFRPKETREFVLYHKIAVDAIMAANPVNIQFTAIKDMYEEE